MLSGILVVNPNNRIRNPFAAIEPPLWAGMIASYHDADILDAEALDLSLEETEIKIRCLSPEKVIIVVMGNNPSVSSTPKMPIAEALADRISDLDIRMAGLHPNAVGSRFKVITAPFRGCPFMPWEYLPMEHYRAHNWHCLDGSPRSPYASIYTSFGCPFNCYYCNIHALYGTKQVRYRPIEDVLREIYILHSTYNVRNIKIWDELFTLQEGRVIAICSGLKGLDLNMWAYARLDTITERVLKAMKEAGINWLAYGFESVADKKFVKRTEDVIRMTRDAGINIIANFMFGAPGTTSYDDSQSVDFAMKHLFEYVNFYDAKPYPGSQWYEDVKPVNVEFDQYKSISGFRQRAFKDYFTNPEYLEMICLKFGQQAVNHIEEMLAYDFNHEQRKPVSV